MTISADAITQKRLVFVKHLYQHALIQASSEHNTINRLMALITFDLATETLLKAILSGLVPYEKQERDFPSLVKQVEITLSNKLSITSLRDKANILNVHIFRNDAQHRATPPSHSTLNDVRTYTRDFLEKSICDVWGLDFHAVSLVDLIQNEKVREYLMQADEALKQKDFQNTLLYSGAGLTWIFHRVENALVGNIDHYGLDTRSFSYRSISERTQGFDELAQIIASVQETLDKSLRKVKRIQETLLFAALGIDYGEYLQYKRIAGNVFFTGNAQLNLHGNPSFDEATADFAFSYVVNTILHIEERVGDVEKPFGKEFWY